MATAKAEASSLLFAVHWLSGGTQQIGVGTGILRGAPANLIPGSRSLASKASRCSSVRSPPLPLLRDGFSSDGHCQEQEHLWQQLFLEPTMWWDDRRDKTSSRSLYFRRKGSGEVLWMNNMFKPAWVDEQLVSLDMQMGHGASPSKSSSPDNPEPGRRAGSEMGSRCSSVRGPALPHPMGHCASPFESRSQDKPEPGRRAGSEMGTVTAVTVSTLCQQGKLSEAVGALESLAQTDCGVSQSLFYTVLKLCTAKKNLVVGRRVHDLTVKLGYESNAYLGNHILRMYACGGRLQQAVDVFNRVGKPDVFMWFSIISAHAKLGKPKEAIQLYCKMRRSGVKANSYVFVAALQACAFAADLESGRKVHSDVLHSGNPTNLFVGNCLVDMYAKCGELKDARQVFDSMATKDVVTWTTLIAGYAQQGLGQEAIVVYGQMEQAGLILADYATFACLLKVCASTGAIQKGRELHSKIVKRGLQDDVVVGTCLVDMYAKCGELEDARQVFDSMAIKNVVTWNALIAGYAQQGLGQEALVVYGQMEEAGLILADNVTLACLLKACASTGAIQKGRELHLKRCGYESNAFLANHLIGMYASLGSLDEAMQVFEKVAVPSTHMWASIILAHARNGHPAQAITLYRRMLQSTVKADNHIFVAVLKACATAGDLESGKEVHADYLGSAVEPNIFTGNCLVEMYAKCGSLEDARRVFDNLPTKDVVTWTVMIAGYVQHEFGQKALALYADMAQDGKISANRVTHLSLVQACGMVGALHTGKQLHFQIQKSGLGADVVLGSCLVDMYGKCGRLEDACSVFRSLPRRDVATWNALLNAYAQNSDGKMAMQTFKEMQQQSIEPNDITFNCLLVACCHVGLVDEGQRLFRMMVDEHGIAPDVYHYTSMADLFGRSGRLDEAESLLETMPLADDVVGWTSLLSACKSHGDIERGRRCFEQIVKREPNNAAAHVLLGNLYANAGRWGEVDRLEGMRKSVGALKKPARASIEVDKKVETFVVGEERADISSKLRSVNLQLQQAGGHVAHTELVLKPMSEKDKEDALCGHAEKLALAYGLLNTPVGSTLLITKNLRMCNDCHSGTKILSTLERREIVVRDAHRVHRFVNGSCSCGDRH